MARLYRKEAHESLAIAMNRLGKWNTGEGEKTRPLDSRIEGHGDSRRSAIKQVASGESE